VSMSFLYCSSIQFAHRPSLVNKPSQLKNHRSLNSFLSPWVNNCVGHYNYAHFIRFLLLVDVSCTYHLVLMVLRTNDAVNSYVSCLISVSPYRLFTFSVWLGRTPLLGTNVHRLKLCFLHPCSPDGWFVQVNLYHSTSCL